MKGLQAGIFIKSTEALIDTVFSGVTLLITECNAAGAVGFVFNRPFGRSLHELEEFSYTPYFPLYDGGPVDKEHLFFLHRRPELIEEGIKVRDNIYSGGNFAQSVTAICQSNLTAKDIKIFVGYCGWDTGELEAEIEEGSWELISGGVEDVFNH